MSQKKAVVKSRQIYGQKAALLQQYQIYSKQNYTYSGKKQRVNNTLESAGFLQ